MMVAERNGKLLLVNARAGQFLESQGYATTQDLNLFEDVLQVDSLKIFGEIEKGFTASVLMINSESCFGGRITMPLRSRLWIITKENK